MHIDFKYPFLHFALREPAPAPENASMAQKERAEKAIKAYRDATQATIDHMLLIPGITRAINIRVDACGKAGYIAVQGDATIEEPTHPANLFIKESNLKTIMRHMQRDYAKYGVGYARVTDSTDTGRVSLAGDDVRLVYERYDHVTRNISNGKLSYTVQGKPKESFTAEQFIELPYQTIDAHVSPLSQLSRASRLYRHVFDYNNTRFDLLTRGVDVIEKATDPKNDLPDIDEQRSEMDLIRDAWEYSRANNVPAMLNDGKMNRAPSDSNVMPFESMLNHLVQEAGRAYGVDSRLLGDPTGSSFRNYETALMALFELTALSQVESFVEQINEKTDFGDDVQIQHDVSGIAQLQSRVDNANTQVTINTDQPSE